MPSLYNIEEELLQMFDNIENNDGEVTDEEYNALCIKQEELRTKLGAYYQAICGWESDAKCCKEEKQRINAVQKKYENRVARLKSAMLDAVKQFGEHGKTNRFIELPTVRLSTRNSKLVEVDEERINIIITYIRDYIAELYANGVIDCNDNVDLSGMIAAVNANIQAEYPDFRPFNEHDLHTIKVKVSVEETISNLFRFKPYVLQQIGSDPIVTEVENVTAKDDFKRDIQLMEGSGVPCNTVSALIDNQTLQIK